MPGPTAADPLEWNRAIGEIVNYSLLKRDANGRGSRLNSFEHLARTDKAGPPPMHESAA